MANYSSFEDLECWKEARKLRNFIKDYIISQFPEIEKYNLRSQISRSSRSVGNNIAEGFGRFNFQENIQFCRTARGSLQETLDHCIVALDEKYISEKVFNEYRIIHDKTLLLINGYIKYLKTKKE